MKQLKVIIYSLILCLFIGSAWASENRQALIIDVNYVMAKSKALEAVRADLGKTFESYSKALSKKEKKLKSSEEELIKQREILSKDAFDKKRRAFEQKIVAFRAEQQDKKKGLDQAMSEALSKVQQKLAMIIEKTAKDKGAELVIRKELLLYAEPGMDQTEYVLGRLNKELPKVKVKIPSQEKQ